MLNQDGSHPLEGYLLPRKTEDPAPPVPERLPDRIDLLREFGRLYDVGGGHVAVRVANRPGFRIVIPGFAANARFAHARIRLPGALLRTRLLTVDELRDLLQAVHALAEGRTDANAIARLRRLVAELADDWEVVVADMERVIEGLGWRPLARLVTALLAQRPEFGHLVP